MDALADPAHPDHAERALWAADMTASDAPFDPAFVAIVDVNRTPAKLFCLSDFGEKRYE